MFERLVKSEYPYSTLSLQHRMRPVISDIVRKMTYPDLKDAERVRQYPELVRGIKKNLLFVNHEFKESTSGLSSSLGNKEEAKLVVQVAFYMLKQGYRASQLVVLTPYRGQARLIQGEMGKKAYMSEADLKDINEAADLDDQIEAARSRMGIRVATVDNFQGEEADIVIISLVRGNNKSGSNIGFLKNANRVNVMLSRAKQAQIIVGNIATFQKNPAWNIIKGMLVEGNHVFAGLPVVCQRHPQTEVLLKDVAMFESCTPDGGCSLDCGEVLKCGHDCPKKCHPLVDGSEFIPNTCLTRLNRPSTPKVSSGFGGPLCFGSSPQVPMPRASCRTM